MLMLDMCRLTTRTLSTYPASNSDASKYGLLVACVKISTNQLVAQETSVPHPARRDSVLRNMRILSSYYYCDGRGRICTVYFSQIQGLEMVRGQRSSPFLNSLRQAIRVRRYSIRTEEAYVGWAKRFILYHDKRHPVDMAEEDVAAFLSHLAGRRTMFERDQSDGVATVSVPYALERKYPGVGMMWGWQYVFPAAGISRDPRSESVRCRSNSGMLTFVRLRFTRTCSSEAVWR